MDYRELVCPLDVPVAHRNLCTDIVEPSILERSNMDLLFEFSSLCSASLGVIVHGEKNELPLHCCVLLANLVSCIRTSLVHFPVHDHPVTYIEDKIGNERLFRLERLTNRTIMQHIGWVTRREGLTGLPCRFGTGSVEWGVSDSSDCASDSLAVGSFSPAPDSSTADPFNPAVIPCAPLV